MIASQKQQFRLSILPLNRTADTPHLRHTHTYTHTHIQRCILAGREGSKSEDQARKGSKSEDQAEAACHCSVCPCACVRAHTNRRAVRLRACVRVQSKCTSHIDIDMDIEIDIITETYSISSQESPFSTTVASASGSGTPNSWGVAIRGHEQWKSPGKEVGKYEDTHVTLEPEFENLYLSLSSLTHGIQGEVIWDIYGTYGIHAFDLRAGENRSVLKGTKKQSHTNTHHTHTRDTDVVLHISRIHTYGHDTQAHVALK